MNRLQDFSRNLIFLLAILYFSFISGCGGGFNNDSSNAQSIGDSIFGADSSR